jgi:5-formyltetrahydrofolate cyclo-ligase
MKITLNVNSLKIWNFNYYHIFMTLKEKNEINTEELINILRKKEKKIVVPKIFENDLKNFQITDSTNFKLNKLGINEPIEGNEIKNDLIDVIFLPLIIFDIKGNRVGYGKGYYDRLLKSKSKKILKIGLSIFDPVDKILDVNNYDIKMDYCVTPKEVFKFN